MLCVAFFFLANYTIVYARAAATAPARDIFMCHVCLCARGELMAYTIRQTADSTGHA